MLIMTIVLGAPRFLSDDEERSAFIRWCLAEFAPHISEARRQELSVKCGSFVMPDFRSVDVLQNWLALHGVDSYWVRIEKGL